MFFNKLGKLHAVSIKFIKGQEACEILPFYVGLFCLFKCLVLYGVGCEILLDHKSYLEYDSVVELTQVKACELLDLLKAIDQSVSVNKQLAAGFGNVEVVFKELLNGEEGLLVEVFDGALLEYLAQEHLAKGGGQLIDKTGNAEVLIADDGLFGVEYLADLKSNLSFLEGAGKILYAGDGGADTDDAVGVELAGERIHNGTGQLFKILHLNAGADFLDQSDVVFIDVYNEILALVREEVLNDVKGGNIGACGYSDKQNGTAYVCIEAQFTGLEVNITGQNVVKNNVLDEVAAVVFFIIILLDGGEGDGKNVCIAQSEIVGTLNKNSIFGVRMAAEGLVGITCGGEAVRIGDLFGKNTLTNLAAAGKITAGNCDTRIINNTNGAVDCIAHLVNNSLEKSVGHRIPSLIMAFINPGRILPEVKNNN